MIGSYSGRPVKRVFRRSIAARELAKQVRALLKVVGRCATPAHACAILTHAKVKLGGACASLTHAKVKLGGIPTKLGGVCVSLTHAKVKLGGIPTKLGGVCATLTHAKAKLGGIPPKLGDACAILTHAKVKLGGTCAKSARTQAALDRDVVTNRALRFAKSRGRNHLVGAHEEQEHAPSDAMTMPSPEDAQSATARSTFSASSRGMFNMRERRVRPPKDLHSSRRLRSARRAVICSREIGAPPSGLRETRARS
jgi:hypothetical protein